MMRRLFILPALFFAVLLVFGCQPSSTADTTSTLTTTKTAAVGNKVGNLAPDFQLQDLEGNTVSLSGLKGSPVILNFWRRGCTYCIREFPYLQEIHQTKSPPLVLLSINIRDAPAKVAEIMIYNELSFPALLDTDGNVSLDYGVSGIPITFFIDKDGIIQAVRLGSFSNSAEIEDYLDRIMP